MTTLSPFFVVGCGRSGTTLMRSMLNRHPRVAIPLESLFIVDYLRARSSRPLDQLKGMLVREPELSEWGLEVTRTDLETCATIDDCIIRLHGLYMAKSGADVWGQKTPRFVRHLDVLLAHFASMRVVHLVRDPRAVVNSLIRSDVHRSDAYHASRRWLQDVGFGLDFEARHPDICIRVYYEDLVTSPDAVIGEVLTFLHLSPERIGEAHPASSGLDEYSEFYANIHANIGRRPTADFIDKWRSQLTEREVEVVEAICGSQMRDLGYEPERTSPRLQRGMVRRLRMRRLYLTALQFYRYLRFRRFHLFWLVWRKSRLGLLREFLWNVNY